MTNTSLLKRIDALTILSDTEQKIANYFEKQYPLIENINKIASSTGVSPASIRRFVNKLGYTNFTELRNESDSQIKTKLLSPVGKYLATESSNSSYYGVKEHFQVCINDFHETISNINEDEFNKAVQLIAGAENVYTVGGASSATVAMLLSIFLKYFRKNVHNIDNNESLLAHNLVDVTSNDLLIVVAFDRISAISMKATQLFHKRNAKIIHISENMHNRLRPFTTVTLPAYSSGTPIFNTRATAVVMVESLCFALLPHCKDDFKKRSQILEQIFQDSSVFYNYY